ncbi:hypothetical protein SUGI_1195780 [Cryptomeria japonica]|nr:hypothetical protein SUGI_1195780 [Cryptomeria japonica]
MVATALGGVSCSFFVEGKSCSGGSKRRPATPSHSREWCCRDIEEEEGKRKAILVMTDEKAKLLRRQLRSTEIGPDGMYHSAIASRLAFSHHEDGLS